MESDKIHLKKRRKGALKSNGLDLSIKSLKLGDEKCSTSTKNRTACIPMSSYFSEFLETLKWLWIALGVAALGYSGYWFAWYIQTLHENQMWFTNIRQVEREISLRTECGLYFSYYKQLVNSSTFGQGFRDLRNDNATENARTINILQRFNIYQEVFLAWLYRILPHKWQMEPILFYVYSIFKLNGFYMSVLFALTWFMCGGGVNWLPGLLSAVFFAVNLTDSTRVYFTINLRECFGFPILWCQILFICIYMKRRKCYGLAKDIFLSLIILILTFLFALTWQFNQFIMLLQSGSIYAVGLMHLIPEWKVRRLLLLELSALLLSCLTQFGQPMLLGSLLVAFVPGAVFSLCICRQWTISGGVVNGSLKLIIQACFTLILTFFVHFFIKRMLQLDADDHIFKFLKGKFGFADPRDFESRIYLCHGAFFFLENDFYLRTSNTLVFPLYVLMLCGCLVVLGKDIMFEWCSLTSSKTKYSSPDTTDITDKIFYFNRRPELAYLLIQSIASGFLAMMALRMKYLWTPHLCVLAAMLLGDSDIWTTLIAKFRVKSAKLWSFLLTSTLCISLSMGLILNYKPVYDQQMTDLKEFYDPDTVELMYWIGNKTATGDSFAGSMQLLAGVKCCTGRHLTNHPHFEDKALRERTVQVYQIYARRKPDEVHRILKSFDTKYIILEDSICLAKSDGCRLPDLIDLDNWHIPDNDYSPVYGLRKSETPRFCDEIRRNGSEYTKFFKLVLQNRTFRVYKLL